jgi:hypothetical protein
MTETDDKPPVTVLYSIGLMNRANRQTFSELGDELTQAGRRLAEPDLLRLQAPRGAHMMTATPRMQMTAPVMSQRSGRKPSRAIPQSSERCGVRYA